MRFGVLGGIFVAGAIGNYERNFSAITLVYEDEAPRSFWAGPFRMNRALFRNVMLGVLLVTAAWAEDIEVGARHVRHYIRPTLPEIAKKMNLHGSVKLEIEIAPSGKVTGVRTLGGHPVLVEAATQAVRDWQFDAAKENTTGPVTVVFQ